MSPYSITVTKQSLWIADIVPIQLKATHIAQPNQPNSSNSTQIVQLRQLNATYRCNMQEYTPPMFQDVLVTAYDNVDDDNEGSHIGFDQNVCKGKL